MLHSSLQYILRILATAVWRVAGLMILAIHHSLQDLIASVYVMSA
jgi:hypothetical protein